ncbi:MAG TPA: hypothetical protein VJI52_05865 [Candidatus Nanoarchaeia archaeon]|nr:hypothetical protein [Candidatus Nanoarchaeia archaeon]
MKKSIAYFGALAILSILLLSACSKKQVEQAPAVIDACSAYTTDLAKSSCYITTALSEKNPSLCSKSPNVDSCLSALWRETKDPNVCAQVEQQKMKDDCLRFVATENNEPSHCYAISDARLRDGCYASIATAKLDVSLCPNIRNQTLKDKCYSLTSPGKTLSSCDEIKDSAIKDKCYGDVGISQQDVIICAQITATEVKDSCFATVGILKRDPSVCESVTSASPKKDCLDRSKANSTLPTR